MRSELHDEFCKKSKTLCDWYTSKATNLSLPIYSSFDIRDAKYKIVNVDGNIYPAGFNNICPIDRETAVQTMDAYLTSKYGSGLKKILLVTEEHTQNVNYWENIATIKEIIEGGGRELKVAFPRKLEQNLNMVSLSGKQIEVLSGDLKEPWIKEFGPSLIVSNNDFSLPYEEWSKGNVLPINPPRELGWYQRTKDRYFKHYNALATEFAGLINLDPFHLTVDTEVVSQFDITDDISVKKLAQRVDEKIAELHKNYQNRGIDQKPFLFVKNNSGTYGLAVIRAGSGQEVLDWNYKSRKKMKAAKGGREVEEVIIQEGIPSTVQNDGAAAEPVIYMIGEDLAGGFLRTHSEKNSTESLNSPGAIYKKLCVSDLHSSLEGSPLENVYGWVAKLGVLAIGLEAKEMGIKF